jgi:predicted PurR-regulated permease PerM
MSPQVLSTAFLVLCSLLLYQLALIFAPFFTPIVLALILARLFYPVYRYLMGLLRGRATIAAALSTLTVTLVAVLPVAYLAFTVVAGLPLIGNISQNVLGQFIVAYGDLQGSLLEGGKAVSGVLLTGAGGLARNTFELISDFFIMLFTLFFFFRDGHRLYEALYDAIPLEESYKAAIFGRLNQTMVAVVRGTLLTALAQGFVAGVTYWAWVSPSRSSSVQPAPSSRCCRLAARRSCGDRSRPICFGLAYSGRGW